MAKSHLETMNILKHEVDTKFDPNIFLLFTKVIKASSARASYSPVPRIR